MNPWLSSGWHGEKALELISYTTSILINLEPMAGSMTGSNSIVIVDYDPEWPVIFQSLKDIYHRELGDLIINVEHVGSTSVPGLCAKPCLDIDLVISNRSRLPDVIDRLSELGYRHTGDQGVLGREAFKREDQKAPYDGTASEKYAHHLYVCSIDSPELRKHLLFREYLRMDTEVKELYCQLKKELAEKFGANRELYTEAKTDFIEGVLNELL